MPLSIAWTAHVNDGLDHVPIHKPSLGTLGSDKGTRRHWFKLCLVRARWLRSLLVDVMALTSVLTLAARHGPQAELECNATPPRSTRTSSLSSMRRGGEPARLQLEL
jgi:hypothetical protein